MQLEDPRGPRELHWKGQVSQAETAAIYQRRRLALAVIKRERRKERWNEPDVISGKVNDATYVLLQ